VAPVPGHPRRASGTAWALTALTTLSSAVFAAGAIAGWGLGLWPATPLTLLAAATVVVGGPLISALLARAIARPQADPAPAPPRATARPARPRVGGHAPLPPATPEQAYGRELLDWRTRPRRG
jgi:hypothetical protein